MNFNRPKQIFTIALIILFSIFHNMVLIAVRQNVKSIDNSVVGHELESARKRDSLLVNSII